MTAVVLNAFNGTTQAETFVFISHPHV